MPRHWEPDYKGPLPGNQLEFITPFAKKGMENGTTAESRVIAYCNEAVGFSLGWSLAPARIGKFLDGVTNLPNPVPLNKDKYFSKRANKGANQYKFLLTPDSKIKVTYFNPETFAKQTQDFARRSISVSFDRTISVTEVKLWAVGAAFDISGIPFLKNIYAIVTPSLKVHPIRSRADSSKTIYISTEMQDIATALGIKKIVAGD